MSTERLELADRGARDGGSGGGAVPPPLPPDDLEAWYAPDVRSQTEVHPGVVVTIRETDSGFAYEVREPSVGEEAGAALERVTDYFGDANLERPRTREGAAERMVGLRLPMDDSSGEERCELSAPPTVEGTEGATDQRVVSPLSDLGYL